MTKEVENWWNDASQSFQEDAKHPTNDAVYGPWVPNESKLKLLGNIKGKKILEIGCGGAQCSVYFAKKGAKCTGIDISKKQLKFAKQLIDKEKIKVKLIKGDIQTLSKIKSNNYDIVFTAYALQYVPDLTKCFKQVNRVLKKGGIFVFSFDHPFWRIIDGKTLKFRGSYHKTGKFSRIEYWHDAKQHKFVMYLRKLSDIYNSLEEAKFHVEKILEPVDLNKKEPLSKLFPKKLVKLIPTAVIFKSKK
ncbi:class I SAM-dependent methyltransferase [Patescibacteria group bacterium]|nr:class I SAM-dependent methyltransferase [Patescibacteria group bacterium]